MPLKGGCLHDDRHLLNNPLGMSSNQEINIDKIDLGRTISRSTLYPNGFSGKRFIDVIENQSIWELDQVMISRA
jgi:hypothetical protein